MIVRKPYAFLIKNFKKIHFVLLLMMFYLLYKTNAVLMFFNEYIETKTIDFVGNLAGTFINLYVYILVFLIIFVALAIYILMKRKKKPVFFYLFLIIFYLILAIIFFQVYDILSVFKINPLSPQFIRLIRDILFIVTFIQGLLVIFVAVRALGFNIKKFNFGEDLQELEIEATDREEVELIVDVESTEITRRVRRRKRELKYFIVENLFVFILLGSILIVAFSIILYLHLEVYNKVYKEKDKFIVNNFVITINNSYITNLNFRGEKITEKNKTFLIVDLDVENLSNETEQIDLNDLLLMTKGQNYSPRVNRYQSFFDLGVGYNDQKIKAKEKRNFILSFYVDEQQLKDQIIFRYTESVYFSIVELQAKYRRILLNPLSLDQERTFKEIKIKDILKIEQKPFEQSNLKISNFFISDRFEYPALLCIRDVCDEIVELILVDVAKRHNHLLLKLTGEYHLDKELKYIKIDKLNTFLSTFGYLEYMIDDVTCQSTLTDVTPLNVIGNEYFLEVSNKVLESKKMDLIIKIRNHKYIYNLK